jgi:hypothetical protein
MRKEAHTELSLNFPVNSTSVRNLKICENVSRELVTGLNSTLMSKGHTIAK